MKEEWRFVSWSKGRYEVSNRGRVRSGGENILKCNPQTDGYPQVSIFVDRVKHLKLVHHLVLNEFVGPCPEGMEAGHKNGKRNDNRVSNLKWCTKKENHEDRKRHGTTGRRKTRTFLGGIVKYQCTKCHKWKVKDEFRKLANKQSYCGIHSSCILCLRIQDRGYKAKRLKTHKNTTLI